MKKSDIGVFGLGVMGRNLALNLEQNQYHVSMFNRMEGEEKQIVSEFMNREAAGKNVTATYSVDEFISSLKTPRIILLMVSAGKPVDAVLSQIRPYLEKGDIIIDGGNTHYSDTNRRLHDLKPDGIHFIGMGVSGGEEGARHGPSLMPGGAEDAWETVKPILTSIAAEAPDQSPCCAWVGPDGAGHFVKMVHNGIEYADMQLIAEAYHLMKNIGMSAAEISTTFSKWNEGKLSSYLTEITADIFKVTNQDDAPLIDRILDTAGQKGTGRWTVISALELGVSMPVISEAVYSRSFSALKNMRQKISKNRKDVTRETSPQKKELLQHLEQALIASRMMALAEGFYLIGVASNEFKWEINLAEVARIWQGGCIIRSVMLDDLSKTYSKKPKPEHLLADPEFYQQIDYARPAWKQVLLYASEAGIPVPALSAAFAEFDTLRTDILPANLIQAQRDYFGAHTYERTDHPRGTFFHTKWSETE